MFILENKDIQNPQVTVSPATPVSSPQFQINDQAIKAVFDKIISSTSVVQGSLAGAWVSKFFDVNNKEVDAIAFRQQVVDLINKVKNDKPQAMFDPYKLEGFVSAALASTTISHDLGEKLLKFLNNPKDPSLNGETYDDFVREFASDNHIIDTIIGSSTGGGFTGYVYSISSENYATLFAHEAHEKFFNILKTHGVNGTDTFFNNSYNVYFDTIARQGTLLVSVPNVDFNFNSLNSLFTSTSTPGIWSKGFEGTFYDESSLKTAINANLDDALFNKVAEVAMVKQIAAETMPGLTNGHGSITENTLAQLSSRTTWTVDDINGFIGNFKDAFASKSIDTTGKFVVSLRKVSNEYATLDVSYRVNGYSDIKLVSQYRLNLTADPIIEAQRRLQGLVDQLDISNLRTQVFEQNIIDMQLHDADGNLVLTDPTKVANWKNGEYEKIDLDKLKDFLHINIDALKNNIEFHGIDDKDHSYGIVAWIGKDSTGKLQIRFSLEESTMTSDQKGPNGLSACRLQTAGKTIEYVTYVDYLKNHLWAGWKRGVWVDEFIGVTSISPESINRFTNFKERLEEELGNLEREIGTSDPGIKERLRGQIDVSASMIIKKMPGSNLRNSYQLNINIFDKLTSQTGKTNPNDLLPGWTTHDVTFNGDKYIGTFAQGQLFGSEISQIVPKSADLDAFVNPTNPDGTVKSIPLDQLIHHNQDVNAQPQSATDFLGRYIEQFVPDTAGLTTASYSIFPFDQGENDKKFILSDDARLIAQNDHQAPIYFYRNPDENADYGMLVKFNIPMWNAQTNTEFSRDVYVFIPITSRPATQQEITDAIKQVSEKATKTGSDVAKAAASGKVSEEDSKNLIARIAEIMDEFQKKANQQGGITEPELHTATMTALSRLSTDVSSKINWGGVDPELAEMVMKILGMDISKISPSVIDTLSKNGELIKRYIKTHPGMNAEQLMHLLENKDFWNMMSKFGGKAMDIIDAAQKISENYKYGYFGGGVALGLAGVGSGAAAASTVIAAKKTAKQTNNKIKIRGHKLVTAVTAAVSMLTIGGSAALLIYFFTQQGGF